MPESTPDARTDKTRTHQPAADQPRAVQPRADQSRADQPAKRPDQPPSGRQRLLTAMRRPSRAQAVVAVLLAVVGFSAVTQVRANEVDNSYAGLREQDLIDVLNGLAGATQRAETEIARLESTRRDLQTSTDNRQAALAQAQERAQTLAIMAGKVPVTGPGIRVTVTENGTPVDVDTVLDTIEELRAAGAEAMQFNGKVRVVAQTAVEPAAGGIEVDGHLLTAPYVIDAIGDPHNLAGGMTFPEGPRQQFESDGQSVKIDQLQSLDIESTVDPTAPEYAQPDGSQ